VQFYLLGDQCIHVLSGDRLGLVFNTSVPAIYYGVKPFRYKADIQKFPTIGDQRQFTKELQVLFVAAGFVIVSEY